MGEIKKPLNLRNKNKASCRRKRYVSNKEWKKNKKETFRLKHKIFEIVKLTEIKVFIAVSTNRK